MKFSRFLVIPAAVLITFDSHGQSTIDSASRFAYGANVGWISFRHDQPSSPAGISVFSSYLTGFAYGANIGWIDFGNTPADGTSYANASADDFGVNLDASGNLSGFAYGANVGWINFGWAAPADANRARIDLGTGTFRGFAYGANIGWINLEGDALITTVNLIETVPDDIDDAWELANFGDLNTADNTTDFDKDGSSDLEEFLAGTDPKDPTDYFRITSITVSGNLPSSATITFTSVPTRNYRIRTSTDLGDQDNWADSTLGIFAPDPGASTTRTVTFPAGPRRFFQAIAIP